MNTDTPEAIVRDLVAALDPSVSDEDAARAGKGYVVRIRDLIYAAAQQGAATFTRPSSMKDVEALKKIRRERDPKGRKRPGG